MALSYTQYRFNKRNLIDNYIDDDDMMINNIATNTNNTNNNNKKKNDIRESDIKIMDKIERENLVNLSYEKLIEFENVCSKWPVVKHQNLANNLQIFLLT